MNKLFAVLAMAVAWLFVTTPAVARDTIQLAQAQKGTPPAGGRVRSSSVGGLGFVIPAIRSTAPELLGIVDYAAHRLHMRCVRKEAFEWPGVTPASEEGLKLHLAVDRSLLIEGYNYTARELPPPEEGLEIDAKDSDPQEIASVDDKLDIYFSENSDRRAKDPRLLIVWYRESEDLSLILCSAENLPEEKEEE